MKVLLPKQEAAGDTKAHPQTCLPGIAGRLEMLARPKPIKFRLFSPVVGLFKLRFQLIPPHQMQVEKPSQQRLTRLYCISLCAAHSCHSMSVLTHSPQLPQYVSAFQPQLSLLKQMGNMGSGISFEEGQHCWLHTSFSASQELEGALLVKPFNASGNFLLKR